MGEGIARATMSLLLFSEISMANNKIVEQRLEAIRTLLMDSFLGGQALSSSTKGTEREAFVHYFFSGMLPTVHRFGSGDITDCNGARSGQVDLVIEYPFLPGFHTVGAERLYLAEGVAAVLEIKSDLRKEWPKVRATAEKVKKLFRVAERMHFGWIPETIPVFAVGYTGWKTLASVQKLLANDSSVDGILVIDNGLFASARVVLPKPYHNECYSIEHAQGSWSLWGLLCCLHQVIHSLLDDAADFAKYCDPEKVRFLPRLERSELAARYYLERSAREELAGHLAAAIPSETPTQS
jgi:hypothetical protein